MIKIYTTSTCTYCKLLKNSMDKKGIKYKEINDIKILEKNGIKSVPVLEVDNKMMKISEANRWINKQIID